MRLSLSCCCGGPEIFIWAGVNSGGQQDDNQGYTISDNSWAAATALPFAGNGMLGLTFSADAHSIGDRQGSTHDNDNIEYVFDSWTSRTDLPSPGRNGAIGSVISEIGYVYGGQDSVTPFALLVDNDAYDNAGNSWTSKTNLPSPSRTTAGGAAVSSKAYSFGGTGGAPSLPLLDTDEYDPVGNSWAAKTDIPSPARYTLPRTPVRISAKAYIIAGQSLTLKLRDNDEYDPDTWTSKTDCPTPARGNTACGISKDETAGYLCGGIDGSSNILKDNDEYVPDTWASKTDMTTEVVSPAGGTP